MCLCTVAASQSATAQPAGASSATPATTGGPAAGVSAATPGVNDDNADSGAIDDMPEDLRSGHFLIYAGGGFAFMPDALAAAESPDPNVGLGAAGQLTLGVGVNRFLVLGLDGSVARAGAGDDGCSECSVTTVGAGMGLAYHPTHAFALDPWIRYAVGYRFTSTSYQLSDGGEITSASESAIDFAKISLGGDFYPDPVFGFGPYMALDLGLNRLDDTPQLYGNVQLGLRLVFDPMRGGTTVNASVASSGR